MKIFLVTTGEYDSYTVIAPFSTRAKAEEFVAAVSDDQYNEIEEYELDLPITDLIRQGQQVWGVRVPPSGEPSATPMGLDADAITYIISGSSGRTAGDGTFRVEVLAPTAERAIELAVLKRGGS